jgi:LacI family transcriptional regulator
MINYASLDHLISSYRFMGYQQALLQYDVPYDDDMVAFANFTSESGQVAMNALLDRLDEPPSAVFVASDIVAAGAMQAVRERGLRIPADISFVSFNDVAFSRYLTPPLTTGTRPAYQIGVVAGEMLIDTLKHNAPLDRSVLMDSELMIRDSAIKFGSSSRRDGVGA